MVRIVSLRARLRGDHARLVVAEGGTASVDLHSDRLLSDTLLHRCRVVFIHMLAAGCLDFGASLARIVLASLILGLVRQVFLQVGVMVHQILEGSTRVSAAATAAAAVYELLWGEGLQAL